MRLRSSITTLFLLVAFSFLSACESSEERAERFFQSAISLLAAGDQERAIVEFRNVFKLNGRHRAARSEFAALQRRRGNVQAAAGQYLQLVDQYPDDFEGQVALAEIYAEIGNWPEMARYVTAASNLRADDDTLRALQAMSDYQVAVQSDDPRGVAAVVSKTRKLVATLPDNILLRQIMIDNYVRLANFPLALAELDRAIELKPEDRRMYVVRLSVLASLGDALGIETQLKEMIEIFPQDGTSRESLVRWYVSQQQLDEAEDVLRAAVDNTADTIEDMVILIQFLSKLRGEDAALAEINKMIAAGQTDPLILSLRSGFEFDRGNQELAISQMRNALAGMPQGDASRRLSVALSRMLAATGNTVGARALIEQVLSEDRSNVAALKIQANDLIDVDRTGEAILALRTALDQEPRDAATLTLLARAYERDGNQELVGEMLALAMGASNGAPQETVRYAQHLFLLEKFSIAESVLVESLRLSRGNLLILRALGTVYVRTRDWPRAEQVMATMHRLGTPKAISAGNELQTRIFQGQQKLEETISFLEGLVERGEAAFGANLAIARNYMIAGETQKAKAFVTQLLAAAPDDPALRFLNASVDAAIGNVAAAEQTFRSLIDEDNGRVQVWIALFRLLSATDRATEAATLIDSALLAQPGTATLQWIKAGLLEAGGDVQSAIALYEVMYTLDSSNLIIANNLASLLSTANDDPASIKRAVVIARRLRSSKIAPFQDTFGWLAYLQGDTSGAIDALEPAAIGLSEDPMVQYHLAKAYLADQNLSGALAQFGKIVALTGAADTRDFVQEARREFNRLTADQNSVMEN